MPGGAPRRGVLQGQHMKTPPTNITRSSRGQVSHLISVHCSVLKQLPLPSGSLPLPGPSGRHVPQEVEVHVVRVPHHAWKDSHRQAGRLSGLLRVPRA